MSTRLQTVEIYKPGVPFVLYGLEEKPVRPAAYSHVGARGGGDELVVDAADGTVYIWNRSRKWGECEATYKDGTVKVWYEPPTLQDAVDSKCYEKMSFLQFHSDGSVSCRGYGGHYWWSAPRPSAAHVEGFVTVNYCECEECYGAAQDYDYQSDDGGYSTDESYYRGRYRWYDRD
jgi:hypothetical protein